jgi:hypothetical protein
MNQRADEALLQKIRELPPEQQAEVEDFVEFVAASRYTKRLLRERTRATRK